ncbi:unnamed protein product [[Candida] boidinii]|nr:unnamed protein product [[Candida] boidinii]
MSSTSTSNTEGITDSIISAESTAKPVQTISFYDMSNSNTISSGIDRGNSGATSIQIPCSKSKTLNSSGVLTRITPQTEQHRISSRYENGDSLSEKFATKTTDSQLGSLRSWSTPTELTKSSISQISDITTNYSSVGINDLPPLFTSKTSKVLTVSEYDNIGTIPSDTSNLITTSNNIISHYNPPSDIVGNAIRYSPTSAVSFGIFIFILCVF